MGRAKGTHPPRCTWTRDDGTTCPKFMRAQTGMCAEHGEKGVAPKERAKQVREARLLASYDTEPVEKREVMSTNVEGDALAAALHSEGSPELDAHEAAVKEQIHTQAEKLRGGRSAELDDPERRRGTVVAPTGAFTLEGASTRAALELLALEEMDKQRRQEQRRRARGRGSAKKLPPVVCRTFIPESVDTFTPINPQTGRSYVKPGYIGRHVRAKELDGSPTLVKINEYKSWGGEAVLDEHGKPIVTAYGHYMQLPGERYGHRVIRKSHEGAFNSDEYLQDQLYDLGESVNQEAGRHIASAYVGEEHGDRSI